MKEIRYVRNNSVGKRVSVQTRFESSVLISFIFYRLVKDRVIPSGSIPGWRFVG